MSESSREVPSVVERTRALTAGAPVVGAHFIGDTAVLVLGEESLLMAPPGGEPRSVSVHTGAILCSLGAGNRVITGGDDGKVIATDANGRTADIATDARRRWIDHIAVTANGAVAWSAGKQAFVRTKEGAERSVEAASTVGGLAFAPKGLRLAIAHYNGVTLWFPNTQAEPETLEWKGSHLGLTLSPDGRFLVTSMQEASLHGWRLSDRKNMQMSGYSARVRSMAWTAGGGWLVTSGADQLIMWPFQSKDGPMGKQPELRAPRDSRIEIVACHPRQEVVAAGYDDGFVLLVRLADGAEILAKKPGPAPVTALAWNASGTTLLFGTEGGEAGIIDLG
jgi:WD40 repeat protein